MGGSNNGARWGRDGEVKGSGSAPTPRDVPPTFSAVVALIYVLGPELGWTVADYIDM